MVSRALGRKNNVVRDILIALNLCCKEKKQRTKLLFFPEKIFPGGHAKRLWDIDGEGI